MISEKRHITVPIVRLTRTWDYTYKRPRIGGWPLINIPSMFREKGHGMAPAQLRVTIEAGMKAYTVQRITATGKWASTGQVTYQDLDIPGRRRFHQAIAPDWVMEIAEDALERAKAAGAVFWAPYQEFGIPDPANETHEAPSGSIKIGAVGYRGDDIIVYWVTAHDAG